MRYFIVQQVLLFALGVSFSLTASTSLQTISRDQIFQGDYFAFGSAVEVEGEITGDLYVAAGRLIIEGVIHGDVIATGGFIQIDGRIHGNVRVIGGTVIIAGDIGKSCTLLGGSAEILPSATIGSSLVSIAGSISLGGPVEDSIMIVSGNTRISSLVGKNVVVYGGEVRVSSRADIGGSFSYTSSQVAQIEPSAQIKGPIIHQAPLMKQLVEKHSLGWLKRSQILAIVMNFFYTIGVAWIALKLMPKSLNQAADVLASSPWRAFGTGLLVLCCMPLLCVLLLATVLGIPFALMLIAANIFTFYTAKIIAVLYISKKASKRFAQGNYEMLYFSLVLAIYFLISMVAILGKITALAFLIFGAGAAVLAQRNILRKNSSKQG